MLSIKTKLLGNSENDFKLSIDFMRKLATAGYRSIYYSIEKDQSVEIYIGSHDNTNQNSDYKKIAEQLNIDILETRDCAFEPYAAIPFSKLLEKNLEEHIVSLNKNDSQIIELINFRKQRMEKLIQTQTRQLSLILEANKPQERKDNSFFDGNYGFSHSINYGSNYNSNLSSNNGFISGINDGLPNNSHGIIESFHNSNDGISYQNDILIFKTQSKQQLNDLKEKCNADREETYLDVIGIIEDYKKNNQKKECLEKLTVKYKVPSFSTILVEEDKCEVALQFHLNEKIIQRSFVLFDDFQKEDKFIESIMTENASEFANSLRGIGFNGKTIIKYDYKKPANFTVTLVNFNVNNKDVQNFLEHMKDIFMQNALDSSFVFSNASFVLPKQQLQNQKTQSNLHVATNNDEKKIESLHIQLKELNISEKLNFYPIEKTTGKFLNHKVCAINFKKDSEGDKNIDSNILSLKKIGFYAEKRSLKEKGSAMIVDITTSEMSFN